MDPEAVAPACLLTVLYAYDKPHLLPVHNFVTMLHCASCYRPLW